MKVKFRLEFLDIFSGIAYAHPINLSAGSTLNVASATTANHTNVHTCTNTSMSVAAVLYTTAATVTCACTCVWLPVVALATFKVLPADRFIG